MSKGKLKDLLLQKDNRVCADCNAPDPKYASANIGVFICLKCCAVHRKLGAGTSKVLSVTLDDWDDEEIEHVVEVGGNAFANSIYEGYFPPGVSKITPTASLEERSKFIRSKYESQDFLKQSLRISSTSTKDSKQASFSNKIMNSFRNSFSSSNKMKGTGFIGLIKVKVIKGTNLAVRDVFSSDPYVIVQLGLQVQTTVSASNLNPIWNEELMVSVPKNFGVLKLEVYDYDTFSADDLMGDAEIDLQPMINSAMSYGDPSMFGNMQIGKWLKSDDNPLVDDSLVNIVDGRVKQEMTLKLQNVESGLLYIELEWMPLDKL